MERRAITVSGIVQGVGFRPFVHELATRLGLRGTVGNRAGVVLIEAEGEAEALDLFLGALTAGPPPLARVDDVRWVPLPRRGDPDFRIVPSTPDPGGPVLIAPDTATCDACLRELFDPGDRRYRYPFLNCTDCGPRLTIVLAAPYDRERTTMAGFAMCPACRAEYDDPRDRRHHAQPIACPACGPRLIATDGQGSPIDEDPLAIAVRALRSGAVVAIKGLGGYHLACLVDDEGAIAALRRRKQRDERPLAVMPRDLRGAEELCTIDEVGRELLTAPSRPIVLLRRRPGAPVADAVAPGNPALGLMLPYTPLHHLLLHDIGGPPLVMTSGNRADEPIAFDDRDARERLAGIADLFLAHDRPIATRCDDSVTRVVAGRESPIRRSRGYAPLPIDLPVACPRPTLALGGQLKATFALGRNRLAVLSHHLGDLDRYAAYRSYVDAVEHYERLFAIRPELIVHDLHPDYASTAYALERSAGAPLLAVQHHHAHLASCLADNGLDEPAIGVTFDGTGYGLDGAIWGGEFLVGDCATFRRTAHLRYVPMPGGDRAVREPWRMAASHLIDAGLDLGPLRDGVPSASLSVVAAMIERGVNAPPTSSAGRLFDAVAALAGLRREVGYEGQAAIELEWLATRTAADGAYPFAIDDPGDEAGPLRIDTRPLITAVADDAGRGIAPALIGRRFQTTMVDLIAEVCGRLRDRTGLAGVALSGGVFLNALLTAEVEARLTGDGFRVYRQRKVPPNDGGLSLGQLAIAARRETGEVAACRP